jgi:hypothetical protein
MKNILSVVATAAGGVRPPKRGARSAAAALVLLGSLGAAVPGLAQSPSPLPGFNPNLASPGNVNAVIALPDGGIAIGGYFDSVNAMPHGNLARLRPDGSLAADWSPRTSGTVDSLAADADGNVYVGGLFYEVNGQSRSSLVKIRGDGSLDPDWAPSPNASVVSLATDAEGHVYAGGFFTEIGGQPRSGLARLPVDGTGQPDADWHPSIASWTSFNAVIQTLALDGAGSLYVGGDFSAVDGQTRIGLAKLAAATGALDPQWNPSVNFPTEALATDDAGHVYAGGQFTQIGGQVRNGLAKLAGGGTGQVDADWRPAGGWVRGLAVDAAGSVYAAQEGAAPSLAKLAGDGNGAADPQWNVPTDGGMHAVAVNAAGTVHAGGAFSTVWGQSRLGLAVLPAAGGGVGATMDVELSPRVETVLLLPDGDLLVHGDYRKVDGVVRSGLIRLHGDGTPAATPDVPIAGPIYATAVDAAGDVYLAGDFHSVGGLPRRGLAKLSRSLDYQVDPQWNPAPNAAVGALALDADGSVYVGGRFDEIGGRSRRQLARLSGTGAGEALPTWNPSPNGEVKALVVDAAGDLFASGLFTSIGGLPRRGLAKISRTGIGVVDPDWNPWPDRTVLVLAIDGAGQLYVGGGFTNVGGLSRSYIARLSRSGTGAADPQWNPQADDWIRHLAFDSAGDVYAAGDFEHIGGQSRTGLAKLSRQGEGLAEADWNPANDDRIRSLAIDTSSDTLYVAGWFKNIGAQRRTGLAALPGREHDAIFADGFDPAADAGAAAQ